VLKAANIGKKTGVVDAETTPLRDPEHYQYDLNLPDITELWRRGSVIASWLLDLSAAALIQDPALSKFGGRVSDSGEGRWTIKAAIDEGVPAHVLSSALYERFSSRGEADLWNLAGCDPELRERTPRPVRHSDRRALKKLIAKSSARVMPAKSPPFDGKTDEVSGGLPIGRMASPP
jgi:hypothetical protein